MLTTRFGACVLALAAVAATGCSRTISSPTRFIVGAPSHSIAVSTVDDHRVAVLAGSPEAKGIYIISVPDGNVLSSFGVTREASSIVSAGKDGPLYVGVGNNDGKTSVGALEAWSLDGKKLRVTPMPAAVIAASSVEDGRFLMLIGAGSNRAFVPVDVADGRTGPAVNLPANANSIDQCTFSSQEYLLVSIGTDKSVEVSNLDAKQFTKLAVTGDDAKCMAEIHRVLVLQSGIASKSIATLSLPSMITDGQLSAPVDASALARGPGNGLLVLSSAGNASNVRMVDRATIASPSQATLANASAR